MLGLQSSINLVNKQNYKVCQNNDLDIQLR